MCSINIFRYQTHVERVLTTIYWKVIAIYAQSTNYLVKAWFSENWTSFHTDVKLIVKNELTTVPIEKKGQYDILVNERLGF